MARGRELTRLRAALDEAARGQAGAVLVAGDAGVGKTRLVDELAAAAGDALVLTGRCLDVGETGLPYLPFTEALGQLREAGLLDVTARPALGLLLPELALPAGHDGGTVSGLPSVLVGRRPEQDVGQLQLFDAVHGLLGELAERRPVLLVLEDLHWADASTRYLLQFLLSRLRAQRLLVVTTYRSDDLHRGHPLRPLLTELVRLPAVQRLDLTPLSAIDARSLVAALADDLPDDVVLEVAERSDGNPFFAEELIAVATCGDGRVPWTLAEVLLARIERLGPDAQHVVRVASVGGRSVRHEPLRDVAGLDDVALDAALREAVQHHVLLVERDEVYTFRHALLREAVYGDLLPGERVRLHAAYADRLATVGGRGAAAALAHHSLESHDLPRALRASVEAAREAQAAGAPAESLRHLEQALKLWPAVPAEARPEGVTELVLTRRASWAAGTAGQPERAIAFARTATRLVDGADPEVAAEVWQRYAQACAVVDVPGHDAEARRAVEEAWRLVRDRPASPARAWVLAVWAAGLRHDREYGEARERAELALADARATGAESAVADALTTLGLLEEPAGEVGRAREHLTAAVACAMAADAVSTELRARYFLGLHHYDLGELAEAARVFDEGVARAKATGLTWSSFGLELRILQVLTRYYVGEWDGAATAAEPPGLRVSSTVSARIAAAGTHVAVSRGEFEQAERVLHQLRSDWHRDLQIALITGGTGAELALWRGQPEVAVERIADAIEWSRQEGEWFLAGIRLAALGIAGHADLAARARRRRERSAEDAAVAAGRELLAYARTTAELGSPRTGELGPEGRAWLARAAAEESRLTGAGDPELWRAAVDGFGFGSVFEQAVCRWRLAEALLGADRRDEAVRELRQASAVAERLGAAPLREALDLVARRARVALGERGPRDRVDPFTPRERSVLELVARGRTNRQVGEELYISEKTVSVHLSRIMSKLGASRRAEAVANAFDRGLLDLPD